MSEVMTLTRLRELRKKCGWNQDELAKRLAVSRQAVGNYETGEREPDIKTINQLCDIFGVTADYLLGRSDVPTADIPESDWLLLDAYHRASLRDRQLVDSILQEYRADREKESAQ